MMFLQSKNAIYNSKHHSMGKSFFDRFMSLAQIRHKASSNTKGVGIPSNLNTLNIDTRHLLLTFLKIHLPFYLL